MSGDDDIQAQIASIEAQLAAAQQSVAQDQQYAQWQQQPQSTFQQAGYGVLQPLQGFPAQGGAQMAGVQAPKFSKDTDDRSIFVMNIPRIPGQPPVTPEELAAFFADCGHILTCTVLKDRNTNELKGTAYIEFATHEACGRAIDTKNNAIFKGFPLSVAKKRSQFRPRGGIAPNVGRGGRGLGRGGFAMPDPMQAMMALMAMSAGAAFQPRGRGRGRGGHSNHQPFQ